MQRQKKIGEEIDNIFRKMKRERESQDRGEDGQPIALSSVAVCAPGSTTNSPPSH